MLTLGAGEIAVIVILALVLFGPKKLPELGRTIGRAMTEFRRASNDLKSTFEREMQNLERETQDIQVTARQTARELSDHVSYGLAPSENLWNALDDAINTAPVQEQNPAYVSASEVSGAESTGEIAAVTEPLLLEGTVARDEPQPETTAVDTKPEHPHNS